MKRIVAVAVLAVVLCLGMVGCSGVEEKTPEIETVNEYGSNSLALIEQKARNGEYGDSEKVIVTVAIERFSPNEDTGNPTIDDIKNSVFSVVDSTGECTVNVDLKYVDKVRACSVGDVVILIGHPAIHESSGLGDWLSLDDCSFEKN